MTGRTRAGPYPEPRTERTSESAAAVTDAERGTVDGRQVRWERHKAERRQAIVDAALDVIAAHGPGESVHVQQIADQAGLNRSALHRLFADRGDLDLAIQSEITGRVLQVVLAAVSLEGRPRDVVHRIVDAFVQWVLAHPAWVRFAERRLPDARQNPLDEAMQAVATQVEVLISGIALALGVEMTDTDRDSLDPWVSGFVGGGLATVQRWMSKDGSSVRPEQLVDLVSDMIWFQIDGLATSRGIEIPDVPIEELLGPG